MYSFEILNLYTLLNTHVATAYFSPQFSLGANEEN